jgi:hypothetical protein
MAARNYGMAYDTPYNQQIINVLQKYDRERDTNGEPNDIRGTMQGGAVLGADGSVHRGLMRHPQLYHPLLGEMHREMQGGMDLGRTFAPLGRMGMDVAKEIGRYALKEGSKEATRRGKEYADAYMSGQGVMSGGLRPPGMVSPFVRPPHEADHMVAPGTSAAYPAYNALELRNINGGFFGPLAMGVARVAGPAIASSVIGALASKGMEKVLGSGVSSGGGSAACASCEAAQTGGAKKKRGRPKKSAGSILDAKFSINDVKNTGRELLGLGILDEKFSINDIKNTGRDLLGLGVKKKRGRPKGSKKGGSFLGDVGKTLGSVAKTVGKTALDVGKDVAVDVAKQALTSYLTGKSGKPAKSGKGVRSGGLAGVGLMKKGAMSGGAMDGRKRRAEIVKKVMKEQGLKMVDASKYVKQHDLYKK